MISSGGHSGSDKYITYCTRRCELLQANNVEPFLVFDGASLPAKKHKNMERKEQREYNKKRGFKLLQEGNFAAARQCLAKAVQVLRMKLTETCLNSVYAGDSRNVCQIDKGEAKSVENNSFLRHCWCVGIEGKKCEVSCCSL